MTSGSAADALYAAIVVLYGLSIRSLRRQGRRREDTEPPPRQPTLTRIALHRRPAAERA